MRPVVRIVIERLVWLAIAAVVVVGLLAEIERQAKLNQVLQDARNPVDPARATGPTLEQAIRGIRTPDVPNGQNPADVMDGD